MLFRKKIDKACFYCAHSGRIDDLTCLCAKKGIVKLDGKCRKFKYDPLKRIPPRKKPQNFAEYDKVDFTLGSSE